MRRYFHIFFFAAISFTPISVVNVFAELEIAELSRKEEVDFASEILPIFRKNCLACHNAKDADADLNLETPLTISEGGESGAMVIPGNANKSQLMYHIRQSEKPFMPPRRNKVGANSLTPYQLGLISLWINQGAKGEVRNVTEKFNWQPVPLSMTPIYTTAISGDGQFAACSRGNQIFIYHLPTQQLVTRLSDPDIGQNVAHRDLVQSLSFSPDGKTLASGGFRLVKLWENRFSERKKIVNLMPGSEKVSGMDVQGGIAVVAGGLGSVKAVSLKSMMPVWSDHVNGQSAEHVIISPDGKSVAVLFSDGRVRTWEVETGARITRDSSPLNIVVFAWLDNYRIVSAHKHGQVKTWLSNNPDSTLSEWKAAAGVSSLLARKSGETVLVGQIDGVVYDVNVNEGKAVKAIDHGELVSGLRLNRDENRLITTGGAIAKLWDASRWSIVARLQGDPKIDESVRLAEQSLAFAKAEVAYHKSTVEEKQKQLKQDKDAFKKAQDTLATHKKTVVIKVKEKSDSEIALAKLNDELEGLPKKVDLAEKEKTSVNELLSSAEKRLRKSKNNLLKLEKDLQAGLLEKANLVNNLIKLGALASNANSLANDAQLEAGKAKGDENLVSQAIVSKALADRKVGEFEVGLGMFSFIEKKLASLESGKAIASKSLATDQIYLNDAKSKLEQVVKEITAAKDRQKKSGEEKKNLEKKIADSSKTVESAQREVELSKAEIGFTSTNVKNAEDNLTAAIKAQEQAGKLPDVLESTVDFAKARSAAFSQDWIDAVYSVDQSLVFTLRIDGAIQAWSAINGQRAHALSFSGRLIKNIRVLSQGRLVLAGTGSDIEVVDAYPSWSLTRTIGTGGEESKFEDRVIALDFSADGKKLATGGGFPSRGGELYIWNVEDGSEALRIPQAHSDTVSALKFSPDGSKIASGGTDRFARIFETERGKELRSLEGHTGHVLGVSWQRNGRVLASVGADKAVKIWNLTNGEQKKSFSGFSKEVTSVHFLGIGTQLLLSAGDNVVKIVKEDGGEVRKLPQTASYMHSSDVTPDGKFAVAGGFDGVLRVWDVNSGKILYQFEPSKAAGNLANKN
tara:strand:- start:2044 stop:5283 length:3240 start_codon:yes stop_codon:yes gene_type:complete